MIRELGPTLFVKPCREGSSLGVSKVHNSREFQKAIKDAFGIDRKIMIEKAVKGREIECSVLGNDSPIAAEVLGEIVHVMIFTPMKPNTWMMKELI